MFHGLEVRNPFLDTELVRLVWSLPDKFLNKGYSKSILRDILSDYLPSGISRRQKQGFEPPLHKWLRGDLKDWAFEIIKINDNFFDEKKIIDKFESFIKGEKKLTYKLWTIIMDCSIIIRVFLLSSQAKHRPRVSKKCLLRDCVLGR